MSTHEPLTNIYEGILFFPTQDLYQANVPGRRGDVIVLGYHPTLELAMEARVEYIEKRRQYQEEKEVAA